MPSCPPALCCPTGYTWDGVIHKMSDKQWGAMLEVHVTGQLNTLVNLRIAFTALLDLCRACTTMYCCGPAS